MLSVADSAGLPIVGGVDALLIAISARNPSIAMLAALAACVGSVIGSSILFAVARKGGEVFLAKHIEKGTGKRLHTWFEQYGLVTVFIPAVSFLPLPMKIPVFCAGALEVRWRAFLGAVVGGRILHYFALAFLAQKYGSATLPFLKLHWVAAASIALGLALTAFVLLRFASRNATEAGI